MDVLSVYWIIIIPAKSHVSITMSLFLLNIIFLMGNNKKDLVSFSNLWHLQR